MPLRSTRANLLYVPKPNIELFRNSMAYSGSRIWNDLPEDAKQRTALMQFRRKYLQWFHSQNKTGAIGPSFQ